MGAKFAFDQGTKLEVAKQVILTSLLPRLKAKDRLCIITFGDNAKVFQPLTEFESLQLPKIKQAIASIQTHGGTNLTNGLNEIFFSFFLGINLFLKKPLKLPPLK